MLVCVTVGSRRRVCVCPDVLRENIETTGKCARSGKGETVFSAAAEAETLAVVLTCCWLPVRYPKEYRHVKQTLCIFQQH